ncbi:MAG: hypothetical protein FWE90_06250 [Defluviitaleaceae bacterium]|nr:hypothetical protein [Defluviitaleaceae bacterium]
MKTSIYVSADQILAIGYTGKTVNKVASHPLPEGTMFNGNIMDAPFLAECLTSMKKDYPALFKGGVSLVVDGSSILTRKLATPRLSHKQYLQRVRDDFADSISDTNDLVAAYKKLGDGTILGCGVNKQQVDSYADTFKLAGIKLTGIRVGTELLYALVRTTTFLQQATIVLNLLDGTTMLSAIFVKGNNIMMQRTRLYGDEKEQIHAQINDSLSNLNQFVQSQKYDEITQSYYLGISNADMVLLEGRNTHEGINVSKLVLYAGAVEIPPEAHFACLNMQYGQSGIDLIAARSELERYVRSKRPKKWWIPVLTVYAAVLIGIAAYLFMELRDVRGSIGEVEAYLHDPANVFALQELNDLINETNDIFRISRQFGERIDWENSMPAAASRMINQILFGHGIEVNISSFDFNEATGRVRVSASAADATIGPAYVDALYAIGVAQDVIYTGFGAGAGGFSFSVEIILALEEGEDE